MKNYPNLFLITDFNSKSLADLLNIKLKELDINVKYAPYNQVFSSLKEQKNNNKFEYAFIWTHPENILINFSKALNIDF